MQDHFRTLTKPLQDLRFRSIAVSGFDGTEPDSAIFDYKGIPLFPEAKKGACRDL